MKTPKSIRAAGLAAAIAIIIAAQPCAGSLSLTDCTISDSWAMEGGGALFAEYGLLSITGCTFTGNSSTTSPDDYHGGGAARWPTTRLGLMDSAAVPYGVSAPP